MEKQKFHIISFKVNKGEKKVINTNTKIDHNKITGVFASNNAGSSDKNTAVEIGSTLELIIDNEEIFPAGFEVGNVTRKIGVDINALPYKIDEKGQNTPIKITYTDGDSPVVPNEGYIVNIYLTALQTAKK